MEDFARGANKNVRRTEADIRNALSQPEIKHETLEPLLAKFRSACQDFIFLDVAIAAQDGVEARLWDTHTEVKKVLQRDLDSYTKDGGQKRKVERRKAEKVFLTFIKSSQTFYRGYIQRLASNFRGIPEILSLAHNMGFETLSADTAVNPGQDIKKHLAQSCYSALVQLGDLSRWREVGLRSTSPNWGPAVGYYNKAIVFDPGNGKAFNQLAVIAQTDRNHLRIVYHLYQANCVEVPFPRAQENLALEFKKLRSSASRGKPIVEHIEGFDGNKYLYEEFLLFHARCWEENPPDQEEQQHDMIDLIVKEIEEGSNTILLRKFALINIAAEKTAADMPKRLRSLEILRSFNRSTLLLLLILVRRELQDLGCHADNVTGDLRTVEVPPITRRALPSLRLYSGWLLSTVSELQADAELTAHMNILWQVYVSTLNCLLPWCHSNVADIPYLLKEDEDSIAFSAFTPFVRRLRFSRSMQSKPVHNETSFGPRIPDNEMRFRVRDIVRDALLLHKDVEFKHPSVPFQYVNGRFVYLGDENGENWATDVDVSKRGDAQPSQILQESLDATDQEMANMVDDLTRPGLPQHASKRSSMALESPPATARTPTVPAFAPQEVPHLQPSPFNARDLVLQMQQSRGSQPSPRSPTVSIAQLPSIWNTPFAPRPGETPEPPLGLTSAQRMSQTFTGLSPHTSSAEFHTNLTNLQEKIQLRSSPQLSFQPTLSTHLDTPTNLNPWQYAEPRTQPHYSSPWQSQFGSAVSVPFSLADTRAPDMARYGAIGESRPRSSRIPNDDAG